MFRPRPVLFVLLALALPWLAHAEDPAAACGTNAGYAKKIAAAQFPVVDGAQVYDLPNLPVEYPSALLQRLPGAGSFLTVNATQYRLDMPPTQEPPLAPAAERERIRQFAEQLDAQFVVAGTIVDAGTTGPELPLPAVTKYFLSPSRRIEVHMSVYDGYSGALLNRHVHQAVVTGNVHAPDGFPFGSAAFFATDFGRAVDRLLREQAAAIHDDLRCLPLMAKIIKVEGRNVYFDAGTTSLIHPGDRFTVYRLDQPHPYEIAEGLAPANVETRVGHITVKRVMPLVSIGRVDRELPSTLLAPGDLIRSQ